MQHAAWKNDIPKDIMEKDFPNLSILFEINKNK